MKRSLKAALSAMLALVMALAAIPVSAMPRFEAEQAAPEKAEFMPYRTAPEGYNAHDYNKCVQFLEQTDENGVKNGEKLSSSYDPNDPGTWGGGMFGDYFQWTAVNGEQRVNRIMVNRGNFSGSLDLADCTALAQLYCRFNSLTELDVSGCTALKSLDCYNNSLTELDITQNTALKSLNCSHNSLIELDVTHNTALQVLDCYGNSLTELDITHNTALQKLSCSGNSLTELDVTQNTVLHELDCSGNSLTELDVTNNTMLLGLICDSNNLIELDLSNNPWLACDHIRAEGSGYVGYACNYMGGKEDDGFSNPVFIYAYPLNGARFEGFYDENGALISEGEWDDGREGYICEFESTSNPPGTVIARFSESALYGDANGDGEVSVDDALLVMRYCIESDTIGDENLEWCDMNGDGEIDIMDALIIMRVAIGQT